MSRPTNLSRICLTPRLPGIGGMASFQHKLSAGLERRGIRVVYSLDEQPYDAVLVVGGTRRLSKLAQVKKQGIPIYQRLDGMNWIHRVRRTGIRHHLRAEYGNFILQYIRSHLVNGIIYQSEFSQRWWEDKYKSAPVHSTFIHNGVDLDSFTPIGPGERPAESIRILMVEGALAGGYEVGLETGVEMVRRLSDLRPELKYELAVAGRVAGSLKERWLKKSPIPISFTGLVPHDQVPALDRSAHLLYEGDINAACPNAVVEALACGLPVIAFDTGAIRELVPSTAGRVAPYGGDPWKLETPDVTSLARAAAEVITGMEDYRLGARKWAEESLGLDRMIERYLEFLSHA